MVNFQATGKAVKGDSTKGKAFEGSGEAWGGGGKYIEEKCHPPENLFLSFR